MPTRRPINIPVVAATHQPEADSESNCSGNELVALMVLGDSMQAEFSDGEILVIEMGRPATEGAFVIAEVAKDDFILRQLKRDVNGDWLLHALNPAYSDTPIAGLEIIKGIVIQKRNQRSRRAVKFYVEQTGT